MNDPIPVTVLSGSLGAGKTTTLNHVLNSSADLDAAVVVNDMGEVNVDAELVERESTLGGDEEIIELSNGCICCRLRGDMLEEVGRLAEKREFDHLLVESSGISEPIPVAQTFAMGFEDAEFDPRGVYELDTMVSVCDAHRLWQAFESGSALVEGAAEGPSQPEEVLMDQIEFCDVLLLNKCDLVPDDALEEIESILRTLQPRAEIVRTEHGRVDPAEILDTAGSISRRPVARRAGSPSSTATITGLRPRNTASPRSSTGRSGRSIRHASRPCSGASRRRSSARRVSSGRRAARTSAWG